jgi:hypothetical protein
VEGGGFRQHSHAEVCNLSSLSSTSEIEQNIVELDVAVENLGATPLQECKAFADVVGNLQAGLPVEL